MVGCNLDLAISVHLMTSSYQKLDEPNKVGYYLIIFRCCYLFKNF